MLKYINDLELRLTTKNHSDKVLKDLYLINDQDKIIAFSIDLRQGKYKSAEHPFNTNEFLYSLSLDSSISSSLPSTNSLFIFS